MIALHSVSMEIGRRQFTRVLLNDVNWLIKPRTQIAVLGQRTSGVEILSSLIAGTVVPTSGWIERRGSVSSPRGLLRFGVDSLHQLIGRMSAFYKVDPREVREFLAEGLGRNDLFDVAPRLLPQRLKKEVGLLLIYAFPCDFYLFPHSPVPIGENRFQAFCQKAYELRGERSGMIVTSVSSKTVRRFVDVMMGAVVYRGRFTLYQSLADAIAVFDSLPPEPNLTLIDGPEEDLADDVDFDLLV